MPLLLDLSRIRYFRVYLIGRLSDVSGWQRDKLKAHNLDHVCTYVTKESDYPSQNIYGLSESEIFLVLEPSQIP